MVIYQQDFIKKFYLIYRIYFIIFKFLNKFISLQVYKFIKKRSIINFIQFYILFFFLNNLKKKFIKYIRKFYYQI
jgi:hypothetical protein